MSTHHNAVFYSIENKGSFKIEEVISRASFLYTCGGAHICQHAVIGRSYVSAIEYMIYDNPRQILWSPDSDRIYKYDDIITILDKTYYNIYPQAPSDINIKYLINNTKKVYIDLDKVPDNSDGVRIHPLPYLTICELGEEYVKKELKKFKKNEKYNAFINIINENHLFVQNNIDRLGDFNIQDTSIFGTWLGDFISTSNRVPEDYTEIPFNIIDCDTQN